MKFKIKDLFYVIVFVTLFKPYIFNYWNILDNTLNAIKIILVGYFVFKTITKKIYSKRKLHDLSVLVIMMHAAILLSTIINNGNYYRWFIEMLSPVGMVLFLELYYDELEGIIKIWFKIIILFLTLNIVTILTGGVRNEDWLTDYFLGSKDLFNTVFAFYVFLIYMHQSYDKRQKTKVLTGYCMALILAAILLTQSTTMLVEMVIFVAFWIFRESKFMKRLLNYWLFLAVYIVSNIVLLSPRMWTIIWSVLDANLQKGSGSMVARSRMWEGGLRIFSDNKLIGIGKMTEEHWFSYIRNIPFHMQLHNQVVEYLATGGLLLIVIYASILIIAGKNINRYRTTDYGYMSLIICFTLMMASLTTGIYSAEFYLPFVMTAYFGTVKQKQESKERIRRTTR